MSLIGLNTTNSWLVVLRFNATIIAKVISWRSVTHMRFLVFSQPYTSTKKVHFNRGLNSQPPGHESDTLTTEPPDNRQTVYIDSRSDCTFDAV